MSRRELRVQRRDTLPRLAWCATLRRGEDAVAVEVGPWVEVTATWFCEGAWDGDFGLGEFAGAFLMGSGGTVEGDAVLFATPSHTLERLHLLRAGDVLFVSNSLPFVLTRAGDSLDPDYPRYARDLASVIHGLKKYVRALPTAAGNRVELVYHASVTVDRALEIREIPKPAVDPFTSFAGYTGFLESTVRDLHRNATDARRRRRYHPLATISSGYDSPAAAVFARGVGCREALTFRGSRPQKQALRVLPDSGAAIAEALGMRVREYERTEYLRRPGAPEAEFLACGPDGADVTMAAWEEALPGRLLFTGFHGDKVWDRNNHKVGPDIVRGDPSGVSLAEFRLRVGFVHLPLPFLGCTSHHSIHRLSNSTAMRPWSVGDEYDRPIPRRIVESCGVARGAFARHKKAVTAPLLLVGLDRVMSATSRRDFRDFYRVHRPPTARLVNAGCARVYELYSAGAHALNRLLHRWDVSLRVPRFVPRALRYRRGSESLLNHWGVERTRARYALDGAVPAAPQPAPGGRPERAAVSEAQA